MIKKVNGIYPSLLTWYSQSLRKEKESIIENIASQEKKGERLNALTLVSYLNFTSPVCSHSLTFAISFSFSFPYNCFSFPLLYLPLPYQHTYPLPSLAFPCIALPCFALPYIPLPCLILPLPLPYRSLVKPFLSICQTLPTQTILLILPYYQSHPFPYLTSPHLTWNCQTFLSLSSLVIFIILLPYYLTLSSPYHAFIYLALPSTTSPYPALPLPYLTLPYKNLHNSSYHYPSLLTCRFTSPYLTITYLTIPHVAFPYQTSPQQPTLTSLTCLFTWPVIVPPPPRHLHVFHRR